MLADLLDATRGSTVLISTRRSLPPDQIDAVVRLDDGTSGSVTVEPGPKLTSALLYLARRKKMTGPHVTSLEAQGSDTDTDRKAC